MPDSPFAADITKPEIFDCPDDIHVFVAPWELFVSVNWTAPTATDDSGRVTLESSETAGALFSTRGIPVLVTYEATDMNNKSASCSFTVTATGKIRTTIKSGEMSFRLEQQVPMSQFVVQSAHWYVK